eukprot:COSAG01_NODE_40667_length_461_cov_0.491713_1_plen_37_part_01
MGTILGTRGRGSISARLISARGWEPRPPAPPGLGVAR